MDNGEWRRLEVDSEDMETMVKEDEKRVKMRQNVAFKSEFDKSKNEC